MHLSLANITYICQNEDEENVLQQDETIHHLENILYVPNTLLL